MLTASDDGTSELSNSTAWIRSSWDNGTAPEELREAMYAAGECRLRERMPRPPA